MERKRRTKFARREWQNARVVENHILVKQDAQKRGFTKNNSMVDKQPYIQRIQELHKAKTGKCLSELEALNIFESLAVLVGAVYQPIPKEQK
ncbi:MAG: hypothetical protein HYT94_04835 [Parcubacteria group bacterium]|nr:hypothetical protein [Parcubacteria group bacterium]